MTGNRIPPHLGGPLGLAGLALLAGATGIFVMAGSDDPAPALYHPHMKPRSR